MPFAGACYGGASARYAEAGHEPSRHATLEEAGAMLARPQRAASAHEAPRTATPIKRKHVCLMPSAPPDIS